MRKGARRSRERGDKARAGTLERGPDDRPGHSELAGVMNISLIILTCIIIGTRRFGASGYKSTS
jgi:hypothetical protein